MPSKKFLLSLGFLAILTSATIFYYSTQEKILTSSDPNSSISSGIIEIPLSEQLKECLPKSDFESKKNCEQLLLQINSFEGCVSAGFSIMKSNPEQCLTPDGRTFTAQRVKSTLIGIYSCLPHKNLNGPQTEECALGIITPDGNYALNTSLLNNYIDLPTNIQMQVSGYITPIEELSTNFWEEKYGAKGIMSATEILEIN